MAQFNLTWYNTGLLTNPNVTGQKIYHRQKSLGGAYSASGYTPANPLTKFVTSAQSPVLADNIIWEFKVEANCSVGGPTPNDNGNQEGIKFTCLVPTLTKTTNTATIVLNVAGLDISSAKFILHLEADDSIVNGPVTVARTGDTIFYTATGLTPNTDYYWEFVEYAVVNGVQAKSSDDPNILGSCQTGAVTTDLDACLPITSISATATEY